MIEEQIPSQLETSEEEKLAEIVEQANSMKQGSSILMGGSFAINVVLAGSLSLLWGLFNSLQLVTHFPLCNVKFPDNAITYFMMIFEIANFDLV